MHATAAPGITLIDLDERHLAEAHRLSAQENWPHRVEDWTFLLRIGHGTGAVMNERLAGTALLTPYGPDAATCNMIIVDPSARGAGLGRRLMDTILDKAGPRECRLTATEAGRPLYERLGFTATGTIRQHQGMASELPAPDGLFPVTARDMTDVAALDRAATGMDRRALLDLLFREGQIRLLRDTSGPRGYVCWRDFGRGRLAGPLIARDDDTATRLLQGAIAANAGQFLRVDLTDAAASHAALVEAAGLARVGTGIAMTRAGASACPVAQGADVYALASQALC